MIRACLVLALATSAFAGYTGFGGYGLAGYGGYGRSQYGLAHGIGYSGLDLGYGYAPAVARTVATYDAAPAVTAVHHVPVVATYAAAPAVTRVATFHEVVKRGVRLYEPQPAAPARTRRGALCPPTNGKPVPPEKRGIRCSGRRG
ncbi:uncharacterized protein LOC144149171 [Haemaphysalis longicornis]